MAADPDIALNAQRPDLMNTLGSILNFGNSAVAYKQAVATLPANIARAQAESQTSQEQAQQQHLVTARMHISNGAQQLLSLYGTNATPDQARQIMTQTMTNMGAQPDAIRQATSDIPSDQSQIDPWIVKKAQTALSALDQINSKFPAPNMIGTGQQISPVASGNPALTGVPAGTPQGTPTQVQPPPTTPVMQGNKPVLLGALPPAQLATGGAGIQAGPGLGQQIAAETVPSVVSNDIKTTQMAAVGAQQDIGVLQAIKMYAKGAITGVASDRAAYISGLASYLGMAPATLAKTDTDLLIKNSKMLELAGGDTNLAKTIAEGVNPHTTMTYDAIQHASDQIIAQKKLPLIKQQMLANDAQNISKDNGAGYMNTLTKFNQVADPRVLQLPTMTVAEKQQMLKAMSPQEQKEFVNKVRAAEQMGLIKK